MSNIDNENCVICEEIFLNPRNVRHIKNFKNILNTFDPSKSFNIVALEALSYYNTNIMKNRNEFLSAGYSFPDLTKKKILYHLNTCNTCNTHILFSTFNFTSKIQKVFENKINNLNIYNDNDVEMRDEEDEENDGEMEKMENYTKLYKTYTTILLDINKAIKQNLNKH